LSIFESGETIQRLVLSYVYAFFEQVAQSGACINHHPANQRLARWLLMCHDRTDGDNLYITHDFIAQMLGVYRPTVTQAAISLKDKGLVKYSRGMVTILDRRGLEEVSCECYQSIKTIYDHYHSVLEMRHLSERMERTTGKISTEIERRKMIQMETRERLQNLQRAIADIKNLPVRIRVCEKCQRFCDSHNNRRLMTDYIGKRINAEFISVVCTICTKS
jgi:Mn-dependent DtxR family transcriptional regulator